MKKTETRRSKGSGTLFKRNGKYVYQWIAPSGQKKSCQLKNEQGKAITVKAEAEQAAKLLIKEQVVTQRIVNKIEYMTEVAEARNLISRTHIPIADIWDAYMKSPRRTDSSPSTLDFHCDAIVPFQRWICSKYPDITELRDIDETVANEYSVYLWSRGISERTYNARIASLKQIFKVLLKDKTPFDGIRSKVLRTQARNAFTKEQLKAISDTLNNPDYYMYHKSEMRIMLLTMLYTGCRGEDAALLKWSQLDFRKRLLTYIPIKTARKRPIPVVVPVAEILYQTLSEHPRSGSEYVLPSVASRYLKNPSGISVDVTKLLEASGIQTKSIDSSLRRKRPIVQYSMHSFRHTFCTFAINTGIPISTIQDIVGHFLHRQ